MRIKKRSIIKKMLEKILIAAGEAQAKLLPITRDWCIREAKELMILLETREVCLKEAVYAHRRGDDWERDLWIKEAQ